MTAESKSNLSLPKRTFWPRYSLRTLFLVTSLVGVVLGCGGNISYRWQHERATLLKLGVSRVGNVSFHDLFGYRYYREQQEPLRRFWRLARGESALTHVKWVFLTEGHWRDDELPILRELPNLTSVSIRGVEISDKGMDFFADLSKLESLSFNDTGITAQGIRHLRALRSLTSLSLQGLDVSDESVETLPELENLEELRLSNTSITDAGFEKVGQLRRLKKIYIGSNPQLSGSLLRHLSDLKDLEEIWFCNLTLSRSDLQSLSALPKLRSLTLSETAFSDNDVGMLGNLPKLSKLTLLNTKTGNAGVAQLAKLGHLECLTLWGTSISDDGVDSLLCHRNLRHLAITSTVLTDEGFLKLSALPNLTSITAGELITKAAADEFHRRRPQCHVTLNDISYKHLYTVPLPP